MKEFEMHKKIIKPSWYLMPIERLISFFMAGFIGKNTKINKINCEGLKPPYIIFSNHGSLLDFANLVKATYPQKNCWITSIEEFNKREWLMRHIGCIPKRKYTKDTVLIRNIARAMNEQKTNIVIYPEARFSLCGINEDIGTALGKFVKLCKVPVVVFNQKGNFLHSPQWNKKPVRKHLPCEADFIQIATKEEVKTLTAEEIQERIEMAFAYDDFKWISDNHYALKFKNRAKNIHKILYKCPICGVEQKMDSYENIIECKECSAKWEMDEYCKLKLINKGNNEKIQWNPAFSHIPNWYKWERSKVREEIENNTYKFEDEVRIEKLINAKQGFVTIGTGTITQDINGIVVKSILDDGSSFELVKPALSTASLHIEYNFKNRGDAIDIATLDKTYFVFLKNNDNVLTKLHFATEEIFKYMTNKEDKKDG